MSAALAFLEDPPAVTSSDEAVAGLVMLVGGLALVPIAVLLARRIHPGRNVYFARWGFLYALLAVTVMILGGSLLGLLTGHWFPTSDEIAAGADSEVSKLVVGDRPVPVVIAGFAVTLASWLVTCAAIVVMAQRCAPEGWRGLGFQSGRAPSAVAAGLVTLLLTLPAVFGCTLLWPWVLERLGQTIEPQEVARQIALLDREWLWLAVPAGTLVLPLFEEVAFRGFLQPLLVQNFGDKGGVVLTSILFGLAHGLVAFLPIFAFSLVLGGIMLRTQRLVATWLVHATYNGLVMGLLFLPETRDVLLGPGGWCG